jgi:hypothetical protein
VYLTWCNTQFLLTANCFARSKHRRMGCPICCQRQRRLSVLPYIYISAPLPSVCLNLKQKSLWAVCENSPMYHSIDLVHSIAVPHEAKLIPRERGTNTLNSKQRAKHTICDADTEGTETLSPPERADEAGPLISGTCEVTQRQVQMKP